MAQVWPLKYSTTLPPLEGDSATTVTPPSSSSKGRSRFWTRQAGSTGKDCHNDSGVKRRTGPGSLARPLLPLSQAPPSRASTISLNRPSFVSLAWRRTLVLFCPESNSNSRSGNTASKWSRSAGNSGTGRTNRSALD